MRERRSAFELRSKRSLCPVARRPFGATKSRSSRPARALYGPRRMRETSQTGPQGRQRVALISNFIGVLFDGIAYGSLLFLICIGLSVTMGLMNGTAGPKTFASRNSNVGLSG